MGNNGLKPDLVAVGEDGNYLNLYMAAQSYDPLGELYSANGFVAASGTSFATPLVAGAAALVKQAHPKFTALEIKSALVNTASQDVAADEAGNPAGVPGLGGGKLDVGAAVESVVAVNPPTVSFGLITATPISKSLQITNTGNFQRYSGLGCCGSRKHDRHSGDSRSNQHYADCGRDWNGECGSVRGRAVLRRLLRDDHDPRRARRRLDVPYLFLASAGYPANVIQVNGGGDGAVGQDIGPISVELTDQFGLPIAGVPVTFTATGGTLRNADAKTNILWHRQRGCGAWESAG